MNMAFRGLRVCIDLGTDLAASRFRAAAARSSALLSSNITKYEPSVPRDKSPRARPRREYYQRKLFARHPFKISPTQTNCEHRSEARTRLAWGNTEAKEPRALVTPGVPELSIILGSRPCGGVSGDGCHTASTRTAAASLSGGWGCRTVSLTTQG